MYIYVYIYMIYNIYIYIYTYIWMYIYKYLCVRAHTHTHTHTNMCLCRLAVTSSLLLPLTADAGFQVLPPSQATTLAMGWLRLVSSLKLYSLLQNIVSFIGLFWLSGTIHLPSNDTSYPIYKKPSLKNFKKKIS